MHKEPEGGRNARRDMVCHDLCQVDEAGLEEAFTRLDAMNLTDQFLFNCVMEDADVFSAVVSIIMEREIRIKWNIQSEKELRIAPELRKIRLDVVGVGMDHRLVYSEMQKVNLRNLIRRSRYYQGYVDASLLNPGEVDFNRMMDTLMILIGPFDLFGHGLYRYTFYENCLEIPDLPLEDGGVRIFINTKGKNARDYSDEFLALMRYFNDTKDETVAGCPWERIRLIKDYVNRCRRMRKVGLSYMQRWEELVYAKQEGRQEGILEGTVKNIQALMEYESITAGQAMAKLKLSQEDQLKILTML